MRGTTGLFTHDSGIVIEVSLPAQQLIGRHNVPEFVRLLREMMSALGAHQAYVSKRGAAVEVNLFRKDGWRGHMRIQRTR